MSTERNSRTVGKLTKQIQAALREMTGRLHQLNGAVGSHLDLQASDLEMLDEIGRLGPLSPRDLVASTGIHPATVTGILDRLEEGGFISRSPDPTDRRKVRIGARYEKTGEILRLYGPMNRTLAKLCSGYTIAELEVIRSFLEKVGQAASRASAAARLDE